MMVMASHYIVTKIGGKQKAVVVHWCPSEAV